jgi:hypothetical protein
MITYKTTLEFPEGFFQFETNEDKSNEISDYKINQWIEECVAYLKEHKKENCWEISSGNTKVSVARGEDTFQINVYKNYWEKSIPIDCEVEE